MARLLTSQHHHTLHQRSIRRWCSTSVRVCSHKSHGELRFLETPKRQSCSANATQASHAQTSTRRTVLRSIIPLPMLLVGGDGIGKALQGELSLWQQVCHTSTDAMPVQPIRSRPTTPPSSLKSSTSHTHSSETRQTRFKPLVSAGTATVPAQAVLHSGAGAAQPSTTAGCRAGHSAYRQRLRATVADCSVGSTGSARCVPTTRPCIHLRHWAITRLLAGTGILRLLENRMLYATASNAETHRPHPQLVVPCAQVYCPPGAGSSTSQTTARCCSRSSLTSSKQARAATAAAQVRRSWPLLDAACCHMAHTLPGTQHQAAEQMWLPAVRR